MIPYHPEKVYVERSVQESEIVRHSLSRLEGVPVQYIDSSTEMLDVARRQSPSISSGKRELILARYAGNFVKYCPGAQTRGSKGNVCCNYFVINYASNCHMECTYCYLQSYLNFPYMLVYANSDDLLGEVAQLLSAPGDGVIRIGTGELADSLALDGITGYAALLVRFFAAQQRGVLELKTKSDVVDGLLGLDHRGRTVVSWSLNTPYIQKTEEHKTTTIDERLAAALRCVEDGYPVAFHFDPVVYYENWEKEYSETIDRVFDVVPSTSIVWMSVGILRMTRDLQQGIRQRFPGSPLPLGELVPSADGKLRYVKPIRTRMYQLMTEKIRSRAQPEMGLYACMERPEVWSRVFQREPPSDEVVGREVAGGLVQLH